MEKWHLSINLDYDSYDGFDVNPSNVLRTLRCFQSILTIDSDKIFSIDVNNDYIVIDFNGYEEALKLFRLLKQKDIVVRLSSE